MPRKKTIQPEPLYSFQLDDGTPVDVRNDKCCVISQGSQNKDRFILKRDKALELVVDLFLSQVKSKRKTAASMLKSDKAFSEELQRQGYEGDERNLRRLAKVVRMHMRILLQLDKPKVHLAPTQLIR
jgi:hypothetical protein